MSVSILNSLFSDEFLKLFLRSYKDMNVRMYVTVSLSLSLSLYIYIYISIKFIDILKQNYPELKENNFFQIHPKIPSRTDEINLQWNILTDFLVSQ